MKRLALVLSLLLLVAGSLVAQSRPVRGEYMESRSADVYTGQCFANGEAGLVGDQAVLGWQIEEGDWNGVRLDHLGVVAVVKANATLGDPYGNPYPAKAVLIVDQRADASQREALADFARHQGGDLLKDVVRVEAAPVEVALGQQHGVALLRAGRFVTLETRPLGGHDHVCGNEVTYYPPLTPTSHAMPAVAVTDRFTGTGLGVTWETHDKRSAFVGTFGPGGEQETHVHTGQ